MPKASVPALFGMIVASGLAASLLGQTAHSTFVGLAVFFVVLAALSTGVVLRSAGRPPT
jgi:urea transporter